MINPPEPFSWKKAKANAIQTMVRVNKNKARNGKNGDFKAAHPAWVKDAVNKNYTLLTKSTIEEYEKIQRLAEERRKKLFGQ